MDRKVASTMAQQLINESEQSAAEELNEKLESLHSYYTIGHRHLEDFDEALKSQSLQEVYSSETYKSLIVTRELAEEIEDSIISAQAEAIEALKDRKNSGFMNLSLMKLARFHKSIQDFAEVNEARKASMENLLTKISTESITAHLPKNNSSKEQVQKLVSHTLKSKQLSEEKLSSDLEKKYKAEFAKMSEDTNFQIQIKNVQHMGLLLDIDQADPAPTIYPSSGKTGNITGNEFPAKVWALTYDDGPGKASTISIIETLKAKNLKATFFQLTKQMKLNTSVSKLIHEAGMEIASHSWSHQQLTKVGPNTLEKEITQATEEIEKFYGVDVKFFRLPYGAGVNSASIRQKISANKLIHVFWNIDTLDWMSQTPDKIVDRTISMMKKTKHDAGIILMHDIHARTATASIGVMDYLKKDNRRVCTIGEIVDDINQGASEVCSKK